MQQLTIHGLPASCTIEHGTRGARAEQLQRVKAQNNHRLGSNRRAGECSIKLDEEKQEEREVQTIVSKHVQMKWGHMDNIVEIR